MKKRVTRSRSRKKASAAKSARRRPEGRPTTAKQVLLAPDDEAPSVEQARSSGFSGDPIQMMLRVGGTRIGITVDHPTAVNRDSAPVKLARVDEPVAQAALPRTAGVARRDRRSAVVKPEAAPKLPTARARVLADVADEEGAAQWLWRGRLPSGVLACIEGDPGEGKSLVTMDLAARVTTGKSMPFDAAGRTPGGVLVANAEDSAGVLKMRAKAAGTDLQRMHILTGDECTGLLTDLPRLRAEMARADAKLVIVDPMMAALGAGTNAQIDQSVRAALTPLASLAESAGATILLVRHLTKGAGRNAKYRGSGSIGITGAVRSLMAVTPHADRRGERVLSSVKANSGPTPPAAVYRIVAAGKAARVEWIEEIEAEVGTD